MKNFEKGLGVPSQEALPKEIERKFLIKSLPDNLEQYPHKEIRQGYLVVTEDGTEVRLRQKEEKYFQTIKSGGGKVRSELEIEITKEQFEVLWQATQGKRVGKTRYEIPCQGGIIELDVYHDDLAGLSVAEVEFTNEEDSDKFVAPEWMATEVTDDARYKNQNLALRGLPKEE